MHLVLPSPGFDLAACAEKGQFHLEAAEASRKCCHSERGAEPLISLSYRASLRESTLVKTRLKKPARNVSSASVDRLNPSGEFRNKSVTIVRSNLDKQHVRA